MRRFTGHESDVWGQFIDYKANAPDVLKKEISKSALERAHIAC